MHQIQQYLPMIAFGLCAMGFVYLLILYKRKTDLRIWLAQLRQTAERAGEDEAHRQEMLRMTDAELAKYPAVTVPAPVLRKHEACIQLLPKLMFVVGCCGVFFLFMGLFRPRAEGQGNWELYVGPICLLITGCLYWYLERIRPNYARVQQMNRKYLLQKAGGDAEALATLDAILEFYPGVPELWMEKADGMAKAGDLDGAVTAIRKAVALAPQNVDLAVVEVSFHLRKGNLDDAEKAMDAVWNLKKAPSDPRPDIYAAAIALRRGDTEKALHHGEKAVELDSGFLERFMPKDEGLGEIGQLLRKKKLL